MYILNGTGETSAVRAPLIGKSKWLAPLQGNTTELYTTPALPEQRETSLTRRSTDAGLGAPVVEPTRAELLVAIQRSREDLEEKIESVADEVTLLQADLRKVSDRVQITEGSISKLQTEVDALRKQMAKVTSRAVALVVRVEDAAGRSSRYNIRLIGFPERAEGSATRHLWSVG
ncbi:hypothetical protein NDU88_009792 [Pleurodeles waltl]|uniref:Uncharacterized protein n=1 Tax=Pleurodeles waltl TaxID=8319 RepID=A0AAV7PWU1_PLEWA|nr:hypothetical protein NDU88_009792 [Pleurodeles waltl]